MLEPILGKNIFPILRSTLNRLDGRLVDHGERVTYLVCHMLRQMGCPARRMLDLCILAVLHDIGAYKTDEVDDMILFETRRVWNHSIYGYLFIREFSPLRDQAQAVLYHHLDYERFPVGKTESRETALLLHLADGVDTWLRGHPPESLPGFLRENAGKRFDPRQVELFLQVQEQDRLLQNLQSGQYQSELHTLLEGLDITPSEAHQYLRMLVYSVDFRSETTVAHTFMMTALSVQLAWRLGLPLAQCRKIYYGAMLHDLGKIAIPTEILEFPGTLTAPQMALMRTHVSVSEEIIKDFVDPEVCRIAVRHHEKLDGSGYPRGLRAGDLTLSERLVAVADILSALIGRRSYKESFSEEKVRHLLRGMSENGKLDGQVTGLVLSQYDDILRAADEYCRPVIEAYQRMKDEYQRLHG